MHVIFFWSVLLGIANAVPAGHTSSIEKRADPYKPPRNAIYVQTFRTTSGGKLSLLPLIEQKTDVTHIYLSAVHVNEEPGDINLNDDNVNSTVWDTIWQEAAQLQQRGVKVMMMLGGAAPGSYPRLCGGANGAVVSMLEALCVQRLIPCAGRFVLRTASKYPKISQNRRT